MLVKLQYLKGQKPFLRFILFLYVQLWHTVAVSNLTVNMYYGPNLLGTGEKWLNNYVMVSFRMFWMPTNTLI